MSIETYISEEERDRNRRQIKAILMSSGWPENYSNECADLALHAVEQSFISIDRVTSASTNELVQLQSLVYALKISMLKSEYAIKVAQELISGRNERVKHKNS